jgi:multiple sugar transport system substrate-binding protein
MHVREDILKQAGVPYPQTWADVINISSKVSKPPQVYMLGQCLGRDYDSSNHFIPQMWCFGGTMQNNQGALVFKGPGTLEAIKWVKEAYSKQVIPPGATTWDSTGNNKAYQSRQCVITYNPNSIYAYLEANDKDLTSKTGMYNAPGGPKGAFDGIDIRGFASFKGCKNPTAAREALSYFIQPKNYEKIIETGLNRWAPIYKNMMDRPLWDKPAYKNYKKIMTNGRFVAFSGPPNSAIGEVMDQFIISDMLVDVVSNNKDPEKAMNEAYDKMVAIYKKWKQPIA